MARVTAHNGDTHGTADGFTKYRFSGSPTDQFEHRGEVGELRTMTITVECVAEGFDQVNDGVRHQTKWKVLNATLGASVERPADPQLDFGDSDGEKSGEYGDYTDNQAEPDAGEQADEEPSNVVTPQFSSNA